MKRVKGKTEGGKGKGRRKRRKVKGDERGWKGKQSRNKLAKWKWAWREMEEKRRCSVSDRSFVVATLLLQITSLNSLQNLAYRKPLVLEIITWHILIDPDETTCDVL